MKKNLDINKSFDLFWREPLSILTEGLFKLVNIQTNIFKTKPSVSINLDKKMAQITVVNSDKMYNLFRTVLHKRQLQEKQRAAIKNK